MRCRSASSIRWCGVPSCAQRSTSGQTSKPCLAAFQTSTGFISHMDLDGPWPSFGSHVALRFEKAEHGVTEPEVIGTIKELLAAPRTRKRHVEDLPDRRRGAVGHHHDPV